MSYKSALIVLAFFVSVATNIAAQQSDAPVKLVSGPKNVLSEEAIAAGIEGRMKFAITIEKDGSPKDPVLIAGPAWPCGSNPKKELSNVEDAVKANLLKSKFTPAIKDGTAVEARVAVTIALGEEYRKRLGQQAEDEARKQGKLPPRLIQGGVVNGKALSLPRPAYPFAARSERVSGTVSVEVLIDETGKVIRAEAVSGPRLLQHASREAACGGKFSPTLLEGHPVKVSGVITYNFVAP